MSRKMPDGIYAPSQIGGARGKSHNFSLSSSVETSTTAVTTLASEQSAGFQVWLEAKGTIRSEGNSQGLCG